MKSTTSVSVIGASLLAAAVTARGEVHVLVFPLEAAQVVPPTGSPGSGTATVTLDTDTNLLSWTVAHSGLAGPVVAGHFHGPALPGLNAGVQLGLGPPSNPFAGAAVISAAQEADVLAGLWYVDVHTLPFPGGEIRGQVVNAGGPPFRVMITAASGAWDDPAVWNRLLEPDYMVAMPLLPGEAPPGMGSNDYDVAAIRPGHVITQVEPLPRTLGYYLCEEGGRHEIHLPPLDEEQPGVKALIIECFGEWGLYPPPYAGDPPPEHEGVIELRNVAYAACTSAVVELRRSWDDDFDALVAGAPFPFSDAPELDPGGLMQGPETTPVDEEPVEPFDNLTTHRAITEIAVQSDSCVLHDYLVKELGYAKGVLTKFKSPATIGGTTQTWTVTEWLAYGADVEDDDSEIRRYLRHFMVPMGDKGLDLDDGLAPWIDSFRWGYKQRDNAWDLETVHKSLRTAFAERDLESREHPFAVAFRALGQVLHLLEDKASSPHSRNDPHPGWRPEEDYAKAHYGTPAKIVRYTVIDSLTGGPPSYKLNSTLPNHKRFFRFFDTDQWTGQGGFAGFAADQPPGLCELVNINFFSGDTVFERLAGWTPRPDVGDTDLVATIFPAGAPADWKVYKVTTMVLNADAAWSNVKRNAGGNGIIAVNPVCKARCIGKNSVRDWTLGWFTASPERVEATINNGAVLTEYMNTLLPVTAAYAADLVNFVFRVKLEFKVDVNTAANTAKIKIVNRSGDKLKAGIWRFYIEREQMGTTGPLRKEVSVASRAIREAYAGSLDPNAELVVDVAGFLPVGVKLEEVTAWFLTFDGKAGDFDDDPGSRVVAGKLVRR
jgi:hypothetical protein